MTAIPASVCRPSVSNAAGNGLLLPAAGSEHDDRLAYVGALEEVDEGGRSLLQARVQSVVAAHLAALQPTSHLTFEGRTAVAVVADKEADHCQPLAKEVVQVARAGRRLRGVVAADCGALSYPASNTHLLERSLQLLAADVVEEPVYPVRRDSLERLQG